MALPVRERADQCLASAVLSLIYRSEHPSLRNTMPDLIESGNLFMRTNTALAGRSSGGSSHLEMYGCELSHNASPRCHGWSATGHITSDLCFIHRCEYLRSEQHPPALIGSEIYESCLRQKLSGTGNKAAQQLSPRISGNALPPPAASTAA